MLAGCAAEGAGGVGGGQGEATPPPAAAPANPNFPEAAPGASAPAGGAADWTTRFGVVAPGQGRKMSIEEFMAAQQAAGGGPVPIPPVAAAAPDPELNTVPNTGPAPVFAAPVDIRPTEDPDAAPLPDEPDAPAFPTAVAEAEAEAPEASAPEPDLATRFLAALGLSPDDAEADEAADGPPLGVPIPAENVAAAQAVAEQEAARRAAEDLPPGEAAQRGRALLDRGRPVQAERMFRLALVQEGPTEAALVGLGSAWRQMGRRRQAEKLLARAVAAWPASPSARNSHGTALYDLGRFEEAEGEFRIAAELLGRAGRPTPTALSRNIAMSARARGVEPAPIAPPAPLGVVAAAARPSGGAAAMARRAGLPEPGAVEAAAQAPGPRAAPAPLPGAADDSTPPDVPAGTPVVRLPSAHIPAAHVPVVPLPAAAALAAPAGRADPALSAPPPARPAAPAAAPSA
ncbi:Meckel syndrome type 1 protein [Albimonas donghaensis]|uniref:Meckel syndrome type 1 protein n=1 Tax=Albimonas donghaensis TaxID=356660 RepID=A0A1H3E6Z5_9RHOB|nr:tetratricopeptide repeat protein [Albimonas donghaensis]SDX73669.1 Meckel syndrome type 1 protein [Albimonas donghaensis]